MAKEREKERERGMIEAGMRIKLVQQEKKIDDKVQLYHFRKFAE